MSTSISIFFEIPVKMNKLFTLSLELPTYNRDCSPKFVSSPFGVHPPLKLCVSCDQVLASGIFEV